MMVVIGIIAILGAVVVPGFKKAYSEFKINETYALLDSLSSSMRSYYLIYNESHGVNGCPWGNVEDRLLPLLAPPLKKFAVYRYGTPSYGYMWWKFNLYKGLYLVYKDKEVRTEFSWKDNGRFFCLYNVNDGDRVFDRLYYLDDLVERYQKKGYNVSRSSARIEIFSPEGTDYIKWFR